MSNTFNIFDMEDMEELLEQDESILENVKQTRLNISKLDTYDFFKYEDGDSNLLDVLYDEDLLNSEKRSTIIAIFRKSLSDYLNEIGIILTEDDYIHFSTLSSILNGLVSIIENEPLTKVLPLESIEEDKTYIINLLDKYDLDYDNYASVIEDISEDLVNKLSNPIENLTDEIIEDVLDIPIENKLKTLLELNTRFLQSKVVERYLDNEEDLSLDSVRGNISSKSYILDKLNIVFKLYPEEIDSELIANEIFAIHYLTSRNYDQLILELQNFNCNLIPQVHDSSDIIFQIQDKIKGYVNNLGVKNE